MSMNSLIKNWKNNKNRPYIDREFQSHILSTVTDQQYPIDVKQAMFAGGMYRDFIAAGQDAEFGDLDLFITVNNATLKSIKRGELKAVKEFTKNITDAVINELAPSAIANAYTATVDGASNVTGLHPRSFTSIRVPGLPSDEHGGTFDLNCIYMVENPDESILSYLQTFNTNISKCAFYLDSQGNMKSYIDPAASKDFKEKTITWVRTSEHVNVEKELSYLQKIVSKKHFQDYNVKLDSQLFLRKFA